MRSLLGGNSEWEPPESIPNSEVKPLSADGSVGLPHVRVGHRQAPNKTRLLKSSRVFLCLQKSDLRKNSHLNPSAIPEFST